MSEEIYRIKIKDGKTEVELKGDKRFVRKAFRDIQYLLGKELDRGKLPGERKKRRRKPGRKKKPGPKPKPRPKKTPKKNRVDLTNYTLKKLFEFRKPVRENQRVLMLAFYTNKIMKKREFRGVDLEPLYKELSMEVPDNLSYYLRKMSETQNGTIEKGKKQGRYKITSKGIDFLYDTIPKK
ncbi:MAG: hypothetical protein U9R75_06420 [Candidatus Thermoplasmatota archaeon]|nr:hypothetical protein [Candidatus Thermoplasmatota archaeon]